MNDKRSLAPHDIQRDEKGRICKGSVSPRRGTGMTVEERKLRRKEALIRYNNSPKRKQFMRQYFTDNRLEINKQHQRYSDSFKGKLTRKKAGQQRISKEKGLSSPINWDYWEWLCYVVQYRCQMCGRQFCPKCLTVDHIIPLKLGGDNTWSNIQPLCKSCNSSKRATLQVDIMSPMMHKTQQLFKKEGYIYVATLYR